MPTPHPGVRPAAAFCALLASQAVPAATVVFYDFDDGFNNFTNVAQTVAPELQSASAWTGNGVPVNNQVGEGINSRAAGLVWDATQYLEFSFTIAPGQYLTLTDVFFSERFGGSGGGGGGGAGPQKAFSNGWNLLVNGIERTSGATGLDVDTGTFNGNADGFQAAVPSLPLFVSGLTGTVTIRLTGDTPAPAPGYAQGSWRVDNFGLAGTFSTTPPAVNVPLPGASVALGAGCILSAAHRLRRRN